MGAFIDGSEWTGEVDNVEADEVLEIDRAPIELIASRAVSREEFELVASVAQYGPGDDSGLSGWIWELLDSSTYCRRRPLTVASFRGHLSPHTWSEYPVIMIRGNQGKS